MITIDSLTKKYGANAVVDDISFVARPGRVTGFLGPNGAGKSTTVKMLTTLLSITSGSASVSGVDVASEPDEVRLNVKRALESYE